VIDGKSILAVIPARGGSKGVPRKNIRPVAGKPLIAWTIEQAKRVPFIDRIVVSSDDAEILSVARMHGAETPFVRPAELALDTTPGVDPVLHAVEQLPGYDYVVLLQPTSPLRQSADIEACMRHCLDHDAPACISLAPVEQSPYWMFRLTGSDRLEPLLGGEPLRLRRQDLPLVYAINGAVYIARTDWLTAQRTFLTAETLGYVMPPERSLDLDTEQDFEILQMRLEGLYGKT